MAIGNPQGRTMELHYKPGKCRTQESRELSAGARCRGADGYRGRVLEEGFMQCGELGADTAQRLMAACSGLQMEDVEQATTSNRSVD
ncbi:hypothetical protein GOP47_0007491 [Adiantum capillus-veneris]|uniref:Uncharacterized protein n=1 Tax=Adiantum capillus-veneris TaxID=13818 RepID=A0A9D4V292_ADICA|nr:hypothetical protein GOP47_0007491 [Adiantum capillus-veneris]